ncbi:MAG: NifB/NifX family molybdenum-iron cluster-binding protein [Phycisphaeraceae bacterium]|nr:NifB/NifX family molybdenum-iron cluster-binding protein [Phycisphaeraceae bacterium]
MRIAVPVSDGRVNPHFGQSHAFDLVDVDESHRTIVARRTESAPEGGCGVLPMWLREHGVSLVVCGGLGPGALAKLNHAGIEVIYGAPAEDVGDVIRAMLTGTLQTAGSLCDHHGHGEGHGHGHDHHHEHGESCCHGDHHGVEGSAS